jgi:hypothetical protein
VFGRLSQGPTPINTPPPPVFGPAPLPPPGPPNPPAPPPPPPVAVAVAPMAANAKLNGNPPTIFAGDRDKSDKFLREFDLYWEMNDTHDAMTNPWRRTFTALSYIRGPIVDDWVQLQVDGLRLKTTRANPAPLQRGDAAIWDEFKTDFNTAFTDSTKQQTSYRLLHELRMEKNELDTFVARFKFLATKAGFGHDDSATKDLFARRLPNALLLAILGRETFNPRTATLAEWIAAAQAEIQRYENRNSMLRKWPTSWQSPGKSHKGGFQRSSNTHQRSSYVHPNDRSVPMDVDAARRATTEEAKKKHRLEGRCFECSKQGHMARQCPHKSKRPQGQQSKPRQTFKPKQGSRTNRKPSFRTSFARVAELLDASDEEDLDLLAEDFDAETQELNISDLAARTARFSDNQRNEWVTEMKKLGVDF